MDGTQKTYDKSSMVEETYWLLSYFPSKVLRLGKGLGFWVSGCC